MLWEWFNAINSAPNSIREIIAACKREFGDFVWYVKFVPRVDNMLADGLARQSLGLGSH
ncbi:MAG: hypothetical protein Q8872_03200 [Candidatus Phytoplasma australasiaticum]|nr:hypothetical protein [Candidatus Phytoplasma australasiaticum]